MNRIANRIESIPLGARSAFVYTTATVFSRGLAIITIPIFTRMMSTEQIGIVNLYNSWHGLISVIATLSLTSGGFAVAMKEYEGKRDEYVSSVQTLTSLVALIIAATYFAAPLFWDNIIGLPTSLIMLMLFGLFVEPARDFWMSKQRYEYKYVLPGLISILSALAASVLSVVVVLKMADKGADNLAEGRLFANYFVLFGVAFIIWIYQFLKGKTFINIDYWKLSLRLSIPLIGYQVAAQILSVSDRLMIDKIVDKSAVGIYGTLYAVSSISLLVWNAINASFVPYLFQNIEKEEHKIKEISFGLLEAYAIVAVVLTFIAPEIVKVLATEEYYNAIYIMPPISAGIFFTSVAHMYSNILVYYKRTEYVMYGAVIAAVLNVILNAVFIPMYGYYAAAYTTLVGYIIMALLEAVWAVRIHRNVTGSSESIYDDKKIVLLSVGTIVISLSGIIWYQNDILRYTITVIFAIALYTFVRKMLKDRKNRDA
ncbi:MAG: oligosaccharide flippase family protein [Eubacterium sp.]|nr:oligosaccharide flippase family protein [Eubacterium sp.]